MTKLQELFETADKHSDIDEGNFEEYKKTINLIKQEFERIINNIKENIKPLETLTIENFKASKPFTSPFLNNIFRAYDDKMFEVKQILEKEDITIALQIDLVTCDQIFTMIIGDRDIDYYELNEIDVYKIVYQIYDYLNIYPVLVLLGAYEISNFDIKNLKAYDLIWDT